jgi:MFS transporter, FHS family, Na+ dependent glucose transporter 1
LAALNRKGNPYITTAVYYLGFIGLGLATAALGPTLQGLAQNTGSTLAQISSLFLLTSFGYLLGSLAGGRVYDRIKGHPILGLALLIVAAVMVLIPLSKSLLLLQVLLFVAGFSEGLLDVGTNTLIVWLHGDRVPPFMNGLHAFFGIGTVISPVVVAVLLGSNGSLTTTYWVFAALVLPAGLLIPFFPSPSYIHSNQQDAERPAVPLLVFLAAVIFFVYVGAEVGFGGWVYTYTTSQSFGTPTLAAAINAAFWAAFTVGRLISIPLAVRLKPQMILWIDLGGVVLSTLIILLFPSAEWALWMGTIGAGLFMASVFPTVLNDAQGRMHMSGKTTSWFFVGASLGGMSIPWLMGQIITPFGPASVIVTVLCSTLIAAGVFYALNIFQRARAS